MKLPPPVERGARHPYLCDDLGNRQQGALFALSRAAPLAAIGSAPRCSGTGRRVRQAAAVGPAAACVPEMAA